MPDWIVWMIVGFVVLSVIRRRGGCAWSWRSGELASGRGRGGEREGRALGGGAASLGSGPGAAVAARRRDGSRTGRRIGAEGSRVRTVAPESPVERLKRQFVDGALTMEEYEKALDELDPRQL